jgi:hypothetical protein
MQLRGGEETTLTPGQTFHEGPNDVHVLSRNASATEPVQTVWEAIAPHATRGVTRYMRSEVALLNSAVGLDALGTGFDQFPSDLRDAIVG